MFDGTDERTCQVFNDQSKAMKDSSLHSLSKTYAASCKIYRTTSELEPKPSSNHHRFLKSYCMGDDCARKRLCRPSIAPCAVRSVAPIILCTIWLVDRYLTVIKFKLPLKSSSL